MKKISKFKSIHLTLSLTKNAHGNVVSVTPAILSRPQYDTDTPTTMRPGVGVTKAPFVNFSVSRIFDLVKAPVRLFKSHSYLTGTTAAELRRHLSNINMIFNS